MRLTTRLRQIERRFRPDGASPCFLFVMEDEHGVWHDGKGGIIDPATVTGPLRIIRLIKHVAGPQNADLLEPSSR